MPNDPRFGEQWPPDNTGQSGGTPDADLDGPEAWDVETGSGSAIIAVLDTGADQDHEDLIDNLVPGYDIADDDNDPWDEIPVIVGTDNDRDPVGHGVRVCHGVTAPCASTCWQVGHTQQSRPNCWVLVCHTFFLFLLDLELGGFSRLQKSVCADSSSCCLAVSGRSASSSLKIFWKHRPRKKM